MAEADSSERSAVPNPEEIETLLAKELGAMKFEDRESINEEIHGVRFQARDETQELITDSLRKLDIELQRLSTKHNFDQAMELGSSYVQSHEYRLRFLRCDQWDAQKAAIRIERNLEFITAHFGVDALTRPIYFSDLDRMEQEAMRTGFIQLLPTRDAVGRRVLARFGDQGWRNLDNFQKTRVYIYIFQVLSEDVLTQRLGFVFIIGPQDLTSNPYSHDKRRIVHQLQESFPVKLSAFHLLLPHSHVIQAVRGLILLIIGKEARARTRFHDGTPMEWQYSLASYGINKEVLPITSSGNLKAKAHLKWIAFRQAKENAMMEGQEFNGIECPGHLDIFFRRGGNLNSHPGNRMLREILLARYEHYRTRATQEEKTKVAWSIVEEIEKRGGRFLIESREGYWVELDDRTAAREKISNAIRDIRKTAYGENIIQKTNSSTSRFLNQDHSLMQFSNKRQRTDGGNSIMVNNMNLFGTGTHSMAPSHIPSSYS